MLGFSRKFLGLVLNITLLEYLNQFGYLLQSLITILYLEASLFGALQYFTAITVLPNVLYGHLRYVMTRFLPTADERTRTELFLGTLLLQTGILAVGCMLALGVLSLYPRARFWSVEHSLSPFHLDLVLVALALLVPAFLLHDSLHAYLSGIQKITEAQVVNIGGVYLNVAAAGIVWLAVPDRATGFALILFSRLASRLAGIAWLAVSIARHDPVVFPSLFGTPARAWPAVCRSIYREFIHGYAMPLQLTAVFAYLKENLAVILLGQLGNMPQVAYYDVVRKIYDVPGKLIPDLVRTLTPKIVLAMAQDSEGFRRQFVKFSWLQLGFNGLAGTLLLVAHPLLLIALGMDSNRVLAWTFFLFSVNLVFAASAQTSGYVIQFGRTTGALMVASFLRSVILSIATLLLVPSYGAVGGASALLVSTLFTVLFLAFAVRSSDLWTLKDNLRQALFSSAIALLWLAGTRVLTAIQGAPISWRF